MSAGNGDEAFIGTVEELLAHAHALEQEAADRYAMLADQMEVHNNPEVAGLFRKLAEIEGKHAQHVERMSEGVELPELSPWEYKWDTPESPEALDPQEMHYLMTPHHALNLALRHEKLGAEFFDKVANSVQTDELKALAKQLAEEEYEHVRLLEQWIAKVPRPDHDWAEDPDPPMLQE